MRNLPDSLRLLASQLYSFVLAVVVAIAFRVMIGKAMNRLPQTDPDLLQLREYERAIDKWLSASYNASPDPEQMGFTTNLLFGKPNETWEEAEPIQSTELKKHVGLRILDRDHCWLKSSRR